MNREETGWLAGSPLLPELGGPKLARALLWVISLGVLALIGWTAVTPIHEAARAEGELVPVGHVQQVQHWEGGVVREILVRDGDIVTKGQALMRLDPAITRQDLAELDQRKGALQLQILRLRALIDGGEPDFATVTAVSGELVEDQRRMLAATRDARSHELAVLTRQMDQKQSEIRALEGKRASLAEQIRLSGELHGMQRQLLEKGLTSRMRMIEHEERRARLLGEQQENVTLLERARQAVQEYRQRHDALTAQHREADMRALAEAEHSLAGLTENRAKFAERHDRLEVRAPVAGIVKGLTIHTLGAVAPSGRTLMEIVPLDAPLLADIRISPADRGHIRPGQEVRLRIDSFDFSRYGTLTGRLESISATTFPDAQLRRYYQATVSLPATGHDPADADHPALELMPGMTLDADILTGRKTVLDFLLKPIHRAGQFAFTER